MRSRASAKLTLSPQDEYFHERLDGIFSPSWIKKTARETGLVKRLRTFNPVLFFWILVLQKGVVLQGNMEAVRRKHNEYALEETLSHAAFYARFTPQLVKCLHASALRALEKLGELGGRKLSDRLSGFKDILIQDSTIIRLHEKLHKIIPATRSRKKNQAGAKLSVVVSVKQDGPKTVKLYGERTSEARTMRVGPWVKGRILLIDLGFYYITNLAREQFTAEEIASLYRARWEIELLFRELKSNYALDQIPTSNKRAVEAMIWTSILTLVVHRVAFLTLCELNPERAPHYSHERGAKSFREGGSTILLHQVLDRHEIKREIADFLTFEDCGAFNPHRETSVHIKEWRA